MSVDRGQGAIRSAVVVGVAGAQARTRGSEEIFEVEWSLYVEIGREPRRGGLCFPRERDANTLFLATNGFCVSVIDAKATSDK